MTKRKLKSFKWKYQLFMRNRTIHSNTSLRFSQVKVSQFQRNISFPPLKRYDFPERSQTAGAIDATILIQKGFVHFKIYRECSYALSFFTTPPLLKRCIKHPHLPCMFLLIVIILAVLSTDSTILQCVIVYQTVTWKHHSNLEL